MVTDEDGRFALDGIPPGSYDLHFRYLGMDDVVTRFEVIAGQNSVVNGVMGPRYDTDTTRFVRPIGTRTGVKQSDLRCTIRPVKSALRIGDRPRFEVRIRNKGREATTLVYSLDGSASGRRFPLAIVRIEGPKGGVRNMAYGACGTLNSITPADFVRVGRGEEFDPYEQGWAPPWWDFAEFYKPGRYKAIFRYTTRSTNMRRWMAVPIWTKPDVPGWLSEAVAGVPDVDITCSTTFEVEP